MPSRLKTVLFSKSFTPQSSIHCSGSSPVIWPLTVWQSLAVYNIYAEQTNAENSTATANFGAVNFVTNHMRFGQLNACYTCQSYSLYVYTYIGNLRQYITDYWLRLAGRAKPGTQATRYHYTRANEGQVWWKKKKSGTMRSRSECCYFPPMSPQEAASTEYINNASFLDGRIRDLIR